MPESAPGAADWLDRFFSAFHRHRPVDASFMGVHEQDHRLPDLSEAGLGDALADVEGLLAEVEGLLRGPAGATAAPLARDPQRLDLHLARGVLRQHRWELAGGHMVRGNPSLATGEAVFGFLSLFLTHGGPLRDRLEAAAHRMDGIPDLLGQARRRIPAAPTPWTERAIRECRGALALFGDGVDLLCDELGVDRGGLRSPADRAAAAFADHLAWLESDLLRRPAGQGSAGEEALDLYLRDGHHLRDSADEMVRYARSELAEAKGWLEAHAADFGAGSVEGALALLEETRPSAEGYLAAYARIWDEMRSLAEAERLVSWPEFPIRFVPRPAWVREAAPSFYFLFYRSPAAQNRPPVHEYLVAPLDHEAPPKERERLLRAHNDAVIKLNHVVHHGGLGHHVQNWHAFRAPSRIGRVAAVDGASRIAMPCGGTMAEGWACYATDLVGEVGGLTPLELFAERHSRVRMCARAIVDLELHRGRLSVDEAVAVYQAHAGMSEAAALGEATKNSMFPGMAVMYLMGTDTIHRLRTSMKAILKSDFDLVWFHDTLLSYGSVPVTLVADDMVARASENAPS